MIITLHHKTFQLSGENKGKEEKKSAIFRVFQIKVVTVYCVFGTVVPCFGVQTHASMEQKARSFRPRVLREVVVLSLQYHITCTARVI